MRRVAIAIAAVLAVGGAVAVMGPAAKPKVRVDAVFDTAKGMVRGQVVKIAGTEVGKVEAVKLERRGKGSYKARMELSVDRRFAPFRADATCRILPQGLISENFVECDPGSPDRPPLRAGPTGTATVKVERTAAPATLQDLLNAFSAPAPQRLQILLNELGLATVGRGDDLNAILRRSNPALAESRRVLAVLADQRRQLAAAVGQTDRVLAELADRRGDVRAFVRRANAVAQTTASHSTALGEGVRRLPAMLDAIDRSLGPIERVTKTGAPLLDDLRAAAPGLAAFNRSFPAFAEPAIPAVRRLSVAAATGRKAVPSVRKVTSQLRSLAVRARPVAKQLDRLLISVRDRGFFEALVETTYTMATASAAYDRSSHFVSAIITPFARCIEDGMRPGPEAAPGCSHAYGAPGKGQVPLTEAPPTDGAPSRRSSRSGRNQTKLLLDYLLK